MDRSLSTNFLIPFQAAYSLLQDAASRDRTTARRIELVEILWHERCLNRESLMSRVGDRLGKGCFGDSAWEDTFNRDMTAVRDAFDMAGHKLSYSRTKGMAGYYLQNEERLLPELKKSVAHSIDKIDLRQLKIYHDLGVIQRVRQALKVSEQTRWAVRYARGQRSPGETQTSVAQFIRSTIQLLERDEIVYSVSGYIAGWVWGEPRPVQQLDLILSLQSEQSRKLTEQLQSRGLILTKELPVEETAQTRRTVQIMVVHPQSDLRVNLILPQEEDEFYFEAIRRSVKLDYGRETGQLYILSAEYLILQSLLEYSIDREPERLRCIAAVLLHQQRQLDRVIINQLAEERGWQRIWEEIVAQTDLKMM